MLSYHNEQESHGTCSAMQASVPPPIGGQEVSCGHAQLIKFFLADTANMRHILISQRRIPAGRIVIAFVQTQMLWRIFRYLRPLDYNCLNRCFEQFCIMHVRCCNNCRKRAAICFNEDTAFYAIFCPVRVVWPNIVPAKRTLLIAVSADCHLKSIPPRSAQSAMRAAQILSSRPQFVHR
jgi:hypothetical protein